MPEVEHKNTLLFKIEGEMVRDGNSLRMKWVQNIKVGEDKEAFSKHIFDYENGSDINIEDEIGRALIEEIEKSPSHTNFGS